MQAIDLSCIICFNYFDSKDYLPRVILGCGHTLCSSCISSLLKTPEIARCPLDKIRFQGRSLDNKSFPINYALKQIIEGQSDKDLCKEHNEPQKLVCLTDECKLCLDCAFSDSHKGHKVTLIKTIKSDSEKRSRELKKYLERVDQYYKRLDDIIEEKRADLTKIIKQRFEDSVRRIDERRIQLLFEVNTLFDFERDRLSNILGDDSSIRKDIKQKIEDHVDVLSKKHFYEIIKEDISEIGRSLDNLLAESHIKKFAEGLEEASNSFNESLVTQLNFTTQLQIPLRELSEKLSTIYLQIQQEESLIEEAATTLFSPIIKSILKFEIVKGCLKVTACRTEPKDIVIDPREWKGLTELDFDIYQCELTEEDHKLLLNLWNIMSDLSKVKITIYDKRPCEGSLDSLWPKLIGKSHTLKEIEVNLANCQVGNKGMCHLFSEILPKAKALKSIAINLSHARITNSSLELLGKSALANMKSLQKFKLNLEHTRVSDKGVIHLFQDMRTVKSFFLRLYGTKITDESLDAFILKTLPTMKVLEKFHIFLGETNVTESGIIKIFTGVQRAKDFVLGVSYPDGPDNTMVEVLIKKD